MPRFTSHSMATQRLLIDHKTTIVLIVNAQTGDMVTALWAVRSATRHQMETRRLLHNVELSMSFHKLNLYNY